MEIITTHTHADFDTLGAIVAAKKLYPDAHLVFSGSMEKGMKKAIEELSPAYKFEKAADIDTALITKLILVDTKEKARIGRFSEIIGTKGVEIHIYDHHPFSEGEIRGTVEFIKPVGSTTTILTLILKDKGITPTPKEATILMAGIYEDTGSLSFPSTTVEDYSAAGFLLENGAELKNVGDLLKKELTPFEVSTLADLMESQTIYSIGGEEVIIAAVSLEKLPEDVSTLAHRLMDIERMDCLVLIAETPDRAHVVIRSSIKEINAGMVARALGGGGHREAASAAIKGITLIQAKERVLNALKEEITPKKTAREIMSAPPITIDADRALKNADELMLRYNINAVVVKENGAPKGIITRQIADKAIHHGLGNELVCDYMTAEIECVSPDSSVDEIREKVVRLNQRLLPVVKDGDIEGVITRTDLLKLLQEELAQMQPKAHKKTITNLMKERLPGWAFDLLKDAGECAKALGYNAYAVGGFVRDLLLKRENLDIDIVIEGSPGAALDVEPSSKGGRSMGRGAGIRFSEEFAKRHNAKMRSHERFSTAVLVFPDGKKLDVATARLEYYEKPGALPTVEHSSLKLDLFRRDFSINTLAIALNPDRFGELIDFFDAKRDIKEKTIRILHNLSFIEDPTRTIRAVRFAQRFNFKIAKHTLHLLKNAVKLEILKDVSKTRLYYELKNTLEEENSSDIIKTLDELGLLKLIHKGLKWDERTKMLFERTRDALIWYRLLYAKEHIAGWITLLLALTDGLNHEELVRFADELSIPGKKRQLIIRSRKEGLRALDLLNAGNIASNSALYELFKAFTLEVMLYILAKAEGEDVKRKISTYISKLRLMEPFLKGKDLKALGVKEGPRVGKIMALLLKKTLDGELTSREDEERFAKGLAAE